MNTALRLDSTAGIHYDEEQMKHFLKLLPVLLFSSCTIVDLGGALDEAGKQEATIQQVKQAKKCELLADQYCDAPSPAWKKGDRYYIRLAVAYVPAQDWILLHINPLLPDTMSLPGKLSGKTISNYPTEFYYAVLNEQQFKKICTKYRRIKAPRMDGEHYLILPEKDVDLTGAEKLTDNATRCPAQLLKNRLPVNRSTGNRLRRPLVFVLDVADIPLTVAATPIGWVVDAITWPFLKK